MGLHRASRAPDQTFDISYQADTSNVNDTKLNSSP